METDQNEEKLLRTTARRNANSILLARERAEQGLIQAKEALERKTEEFAHSLAMMRATLDSTTDGILVTDGNRRVTEINKKYVEMWNFPQEIVDSREHQQILDFCAGYFQDSKSYFARIEAIYSSSPPETFDLLELANGKVFERFSKIQHIKDRNVGRVWCFRDVTDRKRTEEVLRREAQTTAERQQELERLVKDRTALLQEAVAQMEEFSYSVSHDLRAPLRAMQGYANALFEDYGNKIDAEGQDYLQRIISAALRMDRLTRDVLTYSKIPRTAMHLDRVSLDRLVFDIVQQRTHEESRRTEIIVETPLLEVVAHEALLAQAVSNLVDNAVKFSSPERSQRIRIWTEARQKQVCLWVEDNGIGIKPEYQDRIWGMFERIHPQSQYEGTGIGLAIVRKAVKRINGTTGIVSDGITGSKFWIQLPAA